MPRARAVDGAAADDAVADFDLVCIERQGHIGSRVQHQAGAEVARLFRLQAIHASQCRAGRVGRQLHEGGRRRDVGGGVVLLRHGRRAEAVADGAAHRNHRRKIVTARQLADLGTAEVGKFFVARSRIEF
jgi:hypothetical protein